MSNEMVTIEQLQKQLPSRKNAITQEVVDIINQSMAEPMFQGESLLQTAVTYESVMVKHKASMKDYLNAIRFSAYLVAFDDNYTEAYKKTFYDREFVQARLGVPTSSQQYSELTSAASRYRKSKLVTDILTLSQVPLDMMFMGARYKALGVLAELATNAKLDRDKINAADKLLLHTASKDIKIELDVGVKQDSAVSNLMEQLAVLAAKQKTMLETGVNTLNDFGSMTVKEGDGVIEGEYV